MLSETPFFISQHLSFLLAGHHQPNRCNKTMEEKQMYNKALYLGRCKIALIKEAHLGIKCSSKTSIKSFHEGKRLL